MFSRMAGLVAVVVFCLAVASLNSQTTAGQKPSLQSRTIPQWQTAAGGKMEFEVASIRLAGPGPFRPPSFALNIDDDSIPPGGRFFADFPLEVYIEFAYKIMLTRQQKDAMLARLPEWSRNDTFVIQAEAAGNPTKDQMRLMMQSLLADRFKLAVHFETRTAPVLSLVLARRGRLGPRLQPHAEGLACGAKWTAPADSSSPSVPPGGFMPICGSVAMIPGRNHAFLLGARDIRMQHIADYIPSLQDFGRPVVDRTGLSGTYDFSLESVPGRITPIASDANPQLDTEGPTLLEALKEQLGLTLRPENAPIQILVIDHVEQPSEN
jgi:bla regulator protein blaR1